MSRHRLGRRAGPAAARGEGGPVGALSATLRRGAAISGFAVVVMQVMALASTLLLARLLSPADVGAYVAGTVLSGFLIRASEGGMRSALVQRETDVVDAADTVFWSTAATGVLLSAMALAAAPLIAVVFRSDLAGQIAAVTSGMLLMYALTNVPDGLMQREFNFKRRLIVDPSQAVAYAVVSVALAASGFGVWSLVIGNYASATVWLVGTWLLARWRPGHGRPSWGLFRELARFGVPLLVQNVVSQARLSVQTALVGRQLGEAALGHLTYGRRLGMLPGVVVVQVGSYVLFPAFARMAGDPARLKRAFLRALRLLWFAGAPVVGLIVAFGQPGVVVLLGEPWRDAGVFLVAMAGYAAGIALKAPSAEAVKGAGRSRLLNWSSAAQLVLGIGLVVIALPYGLLGVGLAISVTEISLAVLLLGFARSVVGFSMRELLRRLIPPMVGCLVALAVFGPLEHLVVRSADRSTGVGLLLIAAEVLGFVIVYLAVIRMVDPPMVADIVSGSRRLLDRKRGGDPRAVPDRAAEGAPPRARRGGRHSSRGQIASSRRPR